MRSVQLQRVLPLLLGGAALAAVLLVYLLYPSARYTGDGTLFAYLVRQFGTDSSAHYTRLLLHPHHFLYGPLSVAFVRFLGPAPEGIVHFEILRLIHLSSLLGVACLGVLFAIIHGLSRRILLPLAMTLLLAFAHGFWFFAVNVEVQTLMLLGLTTFLLVLARVRPGPGGAALLGLAHGLAVQAHIVQVLLLLPAVAHLSLADRPRGAHRARTVAASLLVYLACLALVAGAPYLAALPLLGVDSVAGFLDYLRPGYPASDYLAGPVEGTAAAARSLPGLLVGRWNRYAAAPVVLAAASVGLRALLAGLLVLPWLLGRPAPLDAAGRRLRRGALLTLAAFLPLWVLWDVGNAEFLLLALPPGVILLALAYHRRLMSRPPVLRHATTGLVAATALLLGAYEFVTVVRPQAEPANNAALVRTEFLRRNTRPDDLILLSGVGSYRADKFYLPYFGPRRRLVLQWELLEYGPAAAAEGIRRDLDRAQGAGLRLLVTSDVFEPENLALLEERYGFGRPALEASLAPWDRRPLAELPTGFRLWELVPRAGVPSGAAD
jgi:hypothetical protein